MNLPPNLRSAFPVPSENSDLGITITDYFAAHALTGLLANHKSVIDEDQLDEGKISSLAFRIAIDMVEASEIWRNE